MTREEYRAILNELSLEQRAEICRLHGLAGGKPDDVEGMLWVLEEQGRVAEEIIVKWLNRNRSGPRVQTEAEKVAQATLDAARYAKAALVATVVLGLPGLIVGLIALVKGTG